MTTPPPLTTTERGQLREIVRLVDIMFRCRFFARVLEMNHRLSGEILDSGEYVVEVPDYDKEDPVQSANRREERFAGQGSEKSLVSSGRRCALRGWICLAALASLPALSLGVAFFGSLAPAKIGTSREPGGEKIQTPAVTVPQVRVLIAGMLERVLRVHSQAHICRTMNRRLKRNEAARLYHWHRRNHLPPRRLDQRTYWIQ